MQDKQDALEVALAEIASQRALFRQGYERKLKRLAPELKQAIQRGEQLLTAAHRKKLSSKWFVSAPIGKRIEETKEILQYG